MGISAVDRLKDRLKGPSVLLIEAEVDPGNMILLNLALLQLAAGLIAFKKAHTALLTAAQRG